MDKNQRVRYMKLKSEIRYWTPFCTEATGRAFGWRCPFCGADLTTVVFELAHIEPCGDLGFIPGNIVLSCVKCNRSMGKSRAFDWCAAQGIAFQWMLPILNTLYAIFEPEWRSESGRIIKNARRPDRLQKALDWLVAHEGNLDTPSRDLVNEIGVSHMTIYKAQQLLKENADER